MQIPGTFSTQTERLALAHQTARLASFEWNILEDKVSWAPGSTELYPVPLHEIDSARTWLRLIHPEDRARVWRAVEQVLQTEEEYHERFRVPMPDGENRWILARGRVFCELGRPRQMLGINMDLTEAVAAQEALLASETRFRATFEQAAVGIAHIGLDGSWLRMNRRCCQIVGYSEEELLTLTFGDITHPEDLEADLSLVASLARGERETYSMEKRYLTKSRDIIWVNLTVSMVRTEKGIPDYFLSVIEDITARKKLETERDALIATLEERVRERTAELELLSMTDSLTGIANRRCYDQRLEAEWTRAVRTRQPLSVILVDVDHFKALNDSFGHALGDEVLIKIAQALTGVAQRNTDLVARYGGEEFFLLLPDTDAPSALHVAYRLEDAVRELSIPNPVAHTSGRLTVSQGVATAWPDKRGTGEGLLLAADRAMYKAKQSGRQTICVADPAI
jgi:diguanylate cyclase (GGDEF)-like protein/PAS domain S-box-containing protein